MKALQLQVGAEAWNLYVRRETDPAFSTFSKKVFERDKHKCAFCGFSSAQYMKVVNVDGDYTNNKMSNLVTACPFCQQCLFIESAGKLQSGGGIMIYMPEIQQGQLNALCHVMYAAIVNGSSHARLADSYIQALKLRAPIVEKHYGKHMSDPAFMGQMIIDSPSVDTAKVSSAIFENVRLLPLLDKFETEVASWAGAAV